LGIFAEVEDVVDESKLVILEPFHVGPASVDRFELSPRDEEDEDEHEAGIHIPKFMFPESIQRFSIPR
jgi:hypothetical protein